MRQTGITFQKVSWYVTIHPSTNLLYTHSSSELNYTQIHIHSLYTTAHLFTNSTQTNTFLFLSHDFATYDIPTYDHIFTHDIFTHDIFTTYDISTHDLLDVKLGLDVMLDDGTIIKAEELTGEPLKGRKVVYLGDTSDASNLIEAAKDCDILIHEATTDDARLKDCAKLGHATPSVAARMAIQCNARRLGDLPN